MLQSAVRINAANGRVSGVVTRSDLEARSEAIAVNLTKNVKADGFRKGKVPVNVVKARYAEQIGNEARQAAVGELVAQALNHMGIEQSALLGNPFVTKFSPVGDNIEVELLLSFVPSVDITAVDGLIPSFELRKISDKEVDERINELAKNRAPFVESTDANLKLENGHVGLIDFEGFIDDKAFEGGAAKGFRLLIGSGQFIPGFEDGMLGMKAGEERDVKVTFPENYGKAELAGKPAVFKIKLHKIEVKAEGKVDDEFIKGMLPNEPAPSLARLKELVSQQLEFEERSKVYNGGLKEKLLDALLEGIKFDLPELIVEQETDIVFRNALPQLPKEEVEKLQKDAEAARAKRDSYRADAARSVQATFIIDAIAKTQRIGVSDQEVGQTLYYEALANGQDPQAVIEHYRRNNLIQAVKMAMIEDRVLSFLLDKKLKRAGSDKSAKVDSKEESKADSKPAAKAESKDAKTESKADSKAESKTDSKESSAKDAAKDAKDKSAPKKPGAKK